MATVNFTEMVSVLRNGFEKGLLVDLESRKSVIRALREMLEANENDIFSASQKDFLRPKSVAIASDVLLIKKEATLMLNYMDTWLKDEPVPRSFTSALDTSYIQRQPLGVVLIMGAWNFPLNTLFLPLLGAIAAGNSVLLKPSESCPNLAQLVASLIPEYVDKRICQVLWGGVDVCKELLASVRFDHIMYTGGTVGGRAVYEAAAKFLTPVTLELGGKCPTYVDSDVDLRMAAKRIIWIKTFNCGQICIAPDYVLCHRDVLDEFIEMVGEALEEFFGKDVAKSPDIGRIVNQMHWKRLVKLLSESKGKIMFGGETAADDLYIAPTVVSQVEPDDSLMSQEIFGPILPILTVDSPEEAIQLINSRERPLTVYVYTSNNSVFDMFKAQTTSGALVRNDSVSHVMSAELPFGGVGQSGFGRYHGKYTIDAFSNPRSVLLKSTMEFINENVLYPPYDESKFGWSRWLLSSSDKRGCSIL